MRKLPVPPLTAVRYFPLTTSAGEYLRQTHAGIIAAIADSVTMKIKKTRHFSSVIEEFNSMNVLVARKKSLKYGTIMHERAYAEKKTEYRYTERFRE